MIGFEQIRARALAAIQAAFSAWHEEPDRPVAT